VGTRRRHSYRNGPLDVWRFSTTRHYHICHRSGRLGDRVGYTLVFKLYRPSFLFRGCGKEADFREADKSVEAISFMLDRSLVIQPFIACVTIKELGLPRVRIAQKE
jgi:hypothetical protein